MARRVHRRYRRSLVSIAFPASWPSRFSLEAQPGVRPRRKNKKAQLPHGLHHQSQTEIAGDKRCSRHLSEGIIRQPESKQFRLIEIASLYVAPWLITSPRIERDLLL